MTPMRTIPTAARFTALALTLALAGTAAQAAGFDMFIEIDGVNGETADAKGKGKPGAMVAELEISGPGEAPLMGLLLPAVQKVRESAARSQSALIDIACAGSTIPKAKLYCRKNGPEPHLVIELDDLWDPLESTCRHASLSIL